MERARATWTDERLDDLAKRVDDGFRRVDDDLRQLRTEMTTRFDALQRLMIQLSGITMITVLGTLVTVLATR